MTAWPLVETFDAGRRECTALSWNTNPFEPPALAVAAGATARVWEFNEAYARWVCLANLPGHMGLVHDVAWAPNLSRSYHLIATACADDVARVYKLWPRGKPAALLAALTDAVAAGAAAPAAPAAAPAAGAAADGATAVATQAQAVAAAAGGGAGATADAASGASTAGEPTVELVATLSAHRSQVWRVAWNVTGTALATTGEDGAVRLWSAGLDGTWGQVLVAGGPQF
jgi:nucleoporin SEH1